MIWAHDAAGPADPQPGQFYMLAAAQGWGAGSDERPFLPRAFSFASVRPAAPHDDRAETALGGPQLGFLLEDVGPGTQRLAALEAGEGLWLAGPFGAGFRSAVDRTVLLVGGGIGVAPILALAEQLGVGAQVLLGFRSAAHAEVARLFPAAVELATDDGSVGRHGLVTAPLAEALEALDAIAEGSAGRGAQAARERPAGSGHPVAAPLVQACGPPPMLEAVRTICAERGVEAQLALEAGMACGFGACYGCVVPTTRGYLRLCIDGPVLDGRLLEASALAGAPDAAARPPGAARELP